MNLQFCILITLLKNTHSYKPDRKIESVSNSNSNKKIEITPARYQIANKRTNHDAIANQEAPFDYFPAVEFPTNLMESSKPFYISNSPFPKDVKTAFEFITTTSNRNIFLPIENTNYSAIRDEIAKAKENYTCLLKQDTKAEVLDVDKNMINETSFEATCKFETPVLVFEDSFTNWTSAEGSHEDVDYVFGFIKDLDKILTSVNKTDLNFTDGDHNSTECLSIADETAKYNVSLIELNGNTCPLTSKEQKLWDSLSEDFDDREDPLNITSYLGINESEMMSSNMNTQEGSFEIE